MTSIGEMLRSAREAQGRSVADLAAELCITQRYVNAMEADDIEVLPGRFFFHSFARQYAEILGLDRTQVRQALAAMEPPVETVAASADSHASPLRVLDPIVAVTNRRYLADLPVGLPVAGLLAAVLLGSGIYAWWTRPPQTASGSALRSVKVAQPVQPPSVPTVAALPTSSETPVAASDVPIEAIAQADEAHQVVLNLSATEKTWLSITSGGKVIFSGILEPSQSKTLKGAEVATMKVGNAGGVDIQWNGKSIGPIGPRGQVRTVRFTREHFHILSPEDGSPDDL